MKLSNNLIKALLEEEKMFEEEAYLFNNIRKVLDEDESYLIESQYERAIARSSTYKCWPLSNHVASDFAPSTLREGMELIRYLADFHQAIVMAVPLKLARQASRCGWQPAGNHHSVVCRTVRNQIRFRQPESGRQGR